MSNMKNKLLLILITVALAGNASGQIDFRKVTSTIGSDLEVVDIGDVNNDGLEDIVAGAGFYFDGVNDYHIFIYYQNIDGSLKNPVKYKYPDSYPGLKVLNITDINNDELNDVIIGYADSIGIYYQNSQGSLNPVESFYSGEDVDGLKTGDLNNDGLFDIAVCHWNEDFIKVFYQTNADTFNVISYPVTNAGRDDLDISDVNNDGLDDIIFMPGQGYTGTLHIFYQDKSMGITGSKETFNYEFDNWKTFNGIGTGDLNGDGKTDIAGAIGGNVAAMVLLVQDESNNVLSNPVRLAAYDIPRPVEIYDMNCDSDNEIVVGHDGWNSVTIYQKDSQNQFGSYLRFNASFYFNPNSLAIGDINNDNKPDIVTVGFNEAVFLYNTSKPENFSRIDTMIQNLRIDTDTLENNTSYQEIVIDSTGECHIRNVYINNVKKVTKLEHYTGDSAFYRYGSICKNEYKDTVTLNFDYTIETILSQDTVRLLNSQDTIIYDLQFIKSFYARDTTDMWTELQTDTLRLEDVSISHDTVIIKVDSVKVTNRTLFIKTLASYYDIYQGIRCGQQYIDTVLTFFNESVDTKLIFTDSLLLSKSVERYPSFATSIYDHTGQDFTLYPNPAGDYLRIRLPGYNLTTLEIRILNLDGKVIISDKFEYSDEVEIVTSNLQAGHYIIEIMLDNKKIIVGRFIKS